jgi:hypothetical protein
VAEGTARPNGGFEARSSKQELRDGDYMPKRLWGRQISGFRRVNWRFSLTDAFGMAASAVDIIQNRIQSFGD